MAGFGVDWDGVGWMGVLKTHEAPDGQLHLGDVLSVLAEMPENSVDMVAANHPAT
jgi:hypothetical protein